MCVHVHAVNMCMLVCACTCKCMHGCTYICVWKIGLGKEELMARWGSGCGAGLRKRDPGCLCGILPANPVQWHVKLILGRWGSHPLPALASTPTLFTKLLHTSLVTYYCVMMLLQTQQPKAGHIQCFSDLWVRMWFSLGGSHSRSCPAILSLMLVW